MANKNENLPRLNYLWVGPPKGNKTDQHANGSDVKDVIVMAKNCQNPICYYCLDEHQDYYNRLFEQQNVNVSVQSIDKYLEQMKNQKSNNGIGLHASMMLKMKKEMLKSPRDRIIDRVAFKDAFSLFLLATQGGYTLDTSIRLADENTKNIIFAAHDHFKVPNIPDMNPVLIDCWMMYASPDELNVPMKMLDEYLKKWDNVQRFIRGHEKKIENIEKFHTGITELMINSIHSGLRLIDDKNRIDMDWAFTAYQDKNAQDENSIVKVNGMPVLKQYGNTHKYQFECRSTVIKNINDYINKQTTINRESRKIFLNNLKDELKLYDQINDLGGISCVNKKLNCILETAKELERSEKLLEKVSLQYESSSNDETKIEFAKRIDQIIDDAYKELNTKLQEKDVETLTERAIIKGINKVMNSYKANIKAVAHAARQYNDTKHSNSFWSTNTRFDDSKALGITPRKRRFTL